MATPTSSANISILDSKVVVNLATGNIVVDVTPSVFTGAGATLVPGASVKIVNSVGVTIKDYPATGVDIAPPMTGSVTVPISLVAANYLYGDYTVSVKIKDVLGLEFIDTKNVNICPPNSKDKTQKQGCLNVDISAICKTAQVLINIARIPPYKGTLQYSQVYALTVDRPTVSGLPQITYTIPTFSQTLFEGEYIVKGTVTVTYNFGNNIIYVIPYKVNTKKTIRCQVDECCIQLYLESLYVTSQSDCSAKEKAHTGELIGQALFLKELALGAQNCGNDPSEFILAMESLSGYVCSCNKVVQNNY